MTRPCSAQKNVGCESDCARYRTYLTLENLDLPNAIAVAYVESIHIGSRSDMLLVSEVGRSGKANVGVDSSERQSSEKIEDKNPDFSTFDVETGSTPEKE